MALIRQLAWMSRMIYFSGRHSTAGWTRVSESDSFGGFYAAEFHRPRADGLDVAICFRGTEFFNADYKGGMTTPSSALAFARDAIADVQLFSDSSQQVVAACQYSTEVVLRSVALHKPTTLILTGHSLGASLAQASVVRCPAQTRAVTFCTPLVSLGTKLTAMLARHGKILNITVKGDPITDLFCTGGRAAVGRVVQVPGRPGKTGLDNHDMEALAEWISASPLGKVDVSVPDFDPATIYAG